MLDSNITGALVGAGASVSSGLLGQAFAKRNAKIQTKMQKQLMDYQNDINVQNWQMQNEYNNPGAVLQRYVNAGFSPNQAGMAVLGSVGDTTAGNVQGSSGGSAGMPVAPNIDLTQGVVAMAEAAKLNQEAKVAKQQEEALRIQNMYLEQQNQADLDLKIANRKKAEEERNTELKKQADFVASINLKEEEKKNLEAQTNRLNQLTPIEVLSATQSYQNLIQQGYNLQEEFNLIKEKQATERSQQAADYASAAASYSVVRFNDANANRAAADTVEQDLKNKLMAAGVNPDAADATSKMAMTILMAVPGFTEGKADPEALKEAQKKIETQMTRSMRISRTGEILGPIADTAGQIVGAFTKAGTLINSTSNSGKLNEVTTTKNGDTMVQQYRYN